MSFIISVCKYTKNSKHLLLKSYLFVNFAIIRSKSHALFLLLLQQRAVSRQIVP